MQKPLVRRFIFRFAMSHAGLSCFCFVLLMTNGTGPGNPPLVIGGGGAACDAAVGDEGQELLTAQTGLR